MKNGSKMICKNYLDLYHVYIDMTLFRATKLAKTIYVYFAQANYCRVADNE